MRERTGASWIVYALGALVAAAIVAAALVVGPASGQQSTQTRVVSAQRGVVQSTVSGSGNVAAASQLNLGFKTSGTISAIDVTQGQHVSEGQLLATLDPQSAEVTLEQAKAGLQSAEANLAREEETDGESSSGSSVTGASGSGSGSATASVASVALARTAATTTAQTPAATVPADTSPSATTPAATAPAGASSPASEAPATTVEGSSTGSAKAGKTQATAKQRTATTNAGGSSGSGTSSSEAKSSSGSSSSATSISTATREANIASAKAAVRSERLTVKSDEQAVADTRLLAPENGTIVSLGGEVGESVSGGGTSRASSSGESSSTSGSSSGTGAAAAVGATGSGSSSSGSSSTSSSSFAVLSDLSSMKLVVPLSESEVGSVKAGQIATVTVEALKGAKLAAHVSEVAALSTSNSGVVSYDVTFQLDQLQSGLKAGMSATAEVVVAQAEGVNVPTSAITGGSVTVVNGSKQERRPVTAGLAGDSSTLILSGLKAGERVVLPLASTSGTSSLLSRIAGSGAASGGLGAAGGLSGAGGAGGGGFARGAGGFAGGGRPGG
jgi:HlyD family secretion protein